jgi:hypothetical protein
MPWLLYPLGKSSWCPPDRRLGGPQGCSGSGGKEKRIPSPHPESNPRTPIVQPIAQHYTDCAIIALFLVLSRCNIKSQAEMKSET